MAREHVCMCVHTHTHTELATLCGVWRKHRYLDIQHCARKNPVSMHLIFATLSEGLQSILRNSLLPEKRKRVWSRYTRRPEMIKLVEEKTGEEFVDGGFGNNVFNQTHKAQET